MIRKILVFLLRFTFLMLVPLLLFVYAIKATFFNQDFIYTKFIPASYEPVTSLLAAQSASKTPGKEQIYLERIKTIVPRAAYENILKTAAEPFIAHVKTWVSSGMVVFPAVIEMQQTKVDLRDDVAKIAKNIPTCPPNEKISTEEFGFCKPANMPEAAAKIESSLVDIVDKEIPQNLTLGDASLNAYSTEVNRGMLVMKYFDYIIFTIPLLMLFFIGLLVFEPWSLVLKKLGGTLISVAVSLLLVVIAIPGSINAVLATQPAILPAQKAFIVFIFGQPLSILNYLTAITGILGIAMFIAGKIIEIKIESKLKPKKK